MRNFWCAFFLCLLRAESKEEKAGEINGTLGGSIRFRLRTSSEFASVSWILSRNNIARTMATVKAGSPCLLEVKNPKYQGRLNASGDCRNLEISNLHEDDSATYTGEAAEEAQDFRLKVYKHLLENDLKVECENDTFGGDNYTVQLNCSVGKWGDGVNYTWTSSDKNGRVPSHIVQIQFPDSNMTYTCTAQNPVSKASKTVSVKQTCEAAHPTMGPETEATTENGKQDPLSSGKIMSIAIPVAFATVVIAAVCIGCFQWKKKKRAVHGMPADCPACSVPDECNKTIYAQIDSLPVETKPMGTKKTQEQIGLKDKDRVNTVYATVNPPRQTPLQTDDEKLQMEGQGAPEKNAKAVYSNVTKPQEVDDPSIKTVYDTLSAPRGRDESEFHKLL